MQRPTEGGAPDLTWSLPGHNPIAGIKQGVEEVIAFFEVLRHANINVALVGIDAFGDNSVVGVHRGQGQVTITDASGNPVVLTLDALNCTHYHISDGRIDRVQVYVGDQHMVDAFFNAAYSYRPLPYRLAPAR